MIKIIFNFSIAIVIGILLGNIIKFGLKWEYALPWFGCVWVLSAVIAAHCDHWVLGDKIHLGLGYSALVLVYGPIVAIQNLIAVLTLRIVERKHGIVLRGDIEAINKYMRRG
jgi:hypothetical protein